MCACTQKHYGVSPVCLRRRGGLHLSVHPQPTFSWAPPVLRSLALCHYCPPQRSDLKKNDKFKILSFWRKADTHAQYYNLTDFLTLCVLKVVSPEGADLVLTTHIPHSETDVLVLHCLHIKPWKKTKKKHTIHRTPMQSKHTWMAVLIQGLIFLNSSYQWLGLWWLFLPISACTGWLFFLQRPVRPLGFSSPSSLWGSSINSQKYSPWFWWVVRVLGLDYLNSRCLSVDCHYSRRNRLYERSVKNQKNIVSWTHQCKPCKRHAEGSWVIGNITSKNKKHLIFSHF